jgi:hypothetical protein
MVELAYIYKRERFIVATKEQGLLRCILRT